MRPPQVQIAIFAVTLTGVMWAQAYGAQSSTPASPPSAAQSQAGQPIRLAPGSVIPVVLSHTVDAKKAKAGDPIEVKIAQDLKTNDGQMLAPKDTIIGGHVVASQPHSKETKSELAIVFDHAVLKDGQPATWPMAIQAIIGNERNSAPSSEPASGGDMSPGQASPRGGMGGTGMGGRAPGSGSSSPGGTDMPPQPDAAKSHPPITASTQGVVGMPELKLEDSPQGPVITSEKGNVKLESGTLLLLRVVQQQ